MRSDTFHLSLFLFVMIAGLSGVSNAQNPGKVEEKYSGKLEVIFGYLDSLRGVHPFIENLCPIAIAEEDHFYVFDLDDSGSSYNLVLWEETGMEVPRGVRAAMPLQFYQNRCACVVSGDVFDNPEGYVTIFHEFIHCHQWNTVEPELRNRLPLAVKQTIMENYMWEINHPFPYDDEKIVNKYGEFISALDKEDTTEAINIREDILSMLSDDDYQYMVWQEWKEGFALYVENNMRNALGLPANRVGRNLPQSRLLFYAGGEAYIRMLLRQNPDLGTDIKTLFEIMYSN